MTDEDPVTMDDYIDGTEPDPPSTNISDDATPYECNHCGRSFADAGIRADKILRVHEQLCSGADE